MGINDRESLFEISDAINKKDIGKALSVVNDICQNGKNISAFCKDLCSHYRDLLVAKTCDNPNSILNMTADMFAKLEEQAREYELDRLFECLKIFSGILSELKFSISPRVLLETALVESVSEENLVKKN